MTNILWQNSADKNESVVRKILDVRESFESSRKSIEAEKGRINNRDLLPWISHYFVVHTWTCQYDRGIMCLLPRSS